MLGACECRERWNNLKTVGVLVSAWLCALESFSLPWWDLCLALASPWLLPITSGTGNTNGGVKKPSARAFSRLLEGGKARYKMSWQVKGHPYCLSSWHILWCLGARGVLGIWHHEAALPVLAITRSALSARARLPPGLRRRFLPVGWPGLSGDSCSLLPRWAALEQSLSWFPFLHFNSFL